MSHLRLLSACAVLALALPGLLSGAPAHAQELPESYPAYLAEQLAQDSVFISDHYAGALDLDATREYVRGSVARLDAPVYVLVLPRSAGGEYLDEGFLSAVHDRLSEDGVYLLLENRGSIVDTVSYGTDLSIRDAALEALFTLDYDTPVTVVVDRIMDNALSGESTERLEEARDRWGFGYRLFGNRAFGFRGLLDDLNPNTSTGISNQAFLTGIALGASATFLGLWLFLRRGRRAPTRRGGTIR